MTPPKKSSARGKAHKPTQKKTPAIISAARKAAFQILLTVERGQSHSDELLRSTAIDALSSPDRNLATALVLGVLRWQILLDHRLQSLLTKPNAKLDAEIRIALRLGAFQLLYLDRIPARAAIDESVELAKQAGHKFASGMVNAVLRKLATTPPLHIAEEPATELALAQAHPLWLIERWINLFGIQTARAICHHGQSQPSSTIRLTSPSVETELMQSGILLEPGELLTRARTVVSGDIAATAACREGRVRLQDEGSQLVAEIVGTNSDQQIESILDACAAPGGKTLLLAERNPQARIVALESSTNRFDQLQQRLAHLGDRVECRHADATALSEDSTFDLVLADVPCSGTGTLGRNPEIRHRLRIEDLARQADKQREILRATLRAVRPCGRVVYSTCSLEPEENEQIIAAVLAENPKARLVPLESRINELSAGKILTAEGVQRLHQCITHEGYLRLLPGAFHTDGFFVAMLERIS
jgi:16S rRNA (cytosine967-C5)-methyltransferase